MKMGHIVLTVLCLWSCILTVTPLGQEAVGRAVLYFENQIFGGYTDQYSYFIKFTSDECNRGLQQNDLNNAMKDINVNDVLYKVRNTLIYEGKRMVAAAPKVIDVLNDIREHSEYRLLNPDNTSPISRLLAADPPAGCVIFFSLNSPCVQTCTAPNGRYNIITMLNNTPRLPNNIKDRVFAFWKVFDYDKDKNPTRVWNSWKYLNTKMNLFRCGDLNCIKCLENNIKEDWCFTCPV